VLQARGKIVDEDGAPPEPGSLVSVCGPICFAGETDVRGEFTVAIGSKLALAGPVGEVRAWGEFTWRFPLPPGGSCEIRIWDAGPQGGFDPVLEASGLRDSRWMPTAKELERLPRSIRWEVRALDAAGGEVESEVALAELSPR